MTSVLMTCLALAVPCSHREGTRHPITPEPRGGHSVLPQLAEFTCIHNGTPVQGGDPGTVGQGEGPWNDDRDPYWGGLQMDRGFMAAYGADMIVRHHGGLADTWTPYEQIEVADRAYQVRGFAPWPLTARACGLLR